MNILLCNDDGYLAPGLAALRRALESVATLTIVAPERNHSGASNAITLDRPLRVQPIESNFYAVNGTPADCVHIALTGLLDVKPDLVVSGINNGANLGDDTLYSGTVAAAMEGRFLGLPAVAVSLAGREMAHFETAGKIVQDLIRKLGHQPLPADIMLNINVPDVPLADLKGVRATTLGTRKPPSPAIKAQDPHGKDVYWIGPAGRAENKSDGTDFAAIIDGYASITPVQFDLTHHQRVAHLADWLAGESW
ncbi:MAG: 5'/3'-nucleotidase SurE [Arenicellales bacterium]